MFGLAALIASLSTTVGLTDKTHTLPVWTSWALLGLIIVLAVFVAAVLWPINAWAYTCDAKDIAAEQKEMREVLKSATAAMVGGIKGNDDILGRRIWAYRGVLVVTLAETLIVVAGVISAR
jgi:ABC-type dipeptide/oligopeptide/nickel transport system permease subunit